METGLGVENIGRRALNLDGWGERSVWGWDSRGATLFAQLWRDSEEDDDNDSDEPEIWITPPGWAVTTDPVVLGHWIAEATASPVAAVLSALAQSVGSPVREVLSTQAHAPAGERPDQRLHLRFVRG
jgi:hypothetical protein